jgi:hypothetical protein
MDGNTVAPQSAEYSAVKSRQKFVGWYGAWEIAYHHHELLEDVGHFRLSEGEQEGDDADAAAWGCKEDFLFLLLAHRRFLY